MPIKNRLAEMQEEITAWRRDFHEHPELLFDTHRTSARVAELLKEFGCDEVAEGIGRTGVVAVINGRQNSGNRVVGLRADMDALPIMEATGKEWASKTPGKMHACGHDGHTAMLLGAAKYLAETRNFDGKAVMIFQPAEEGGGGGREMVEEGMMERFGVQEVYGMHSLPDFPVGKFTSCPGPIMAAADQFDIVVTGRGGHAAHPEECIDTTLVAAHIVVALQSIVSRNTDPMKQAVVSTCVFKTEGEAHNVIPQTAVLKGTARSMEPAVRDMLEKRVTEVAEGTAKAFGASAQVNYHRGYPATINPDTQYEYAAEAARKVTGEFSEMTPQMGAEDFSYMLESRPGAYVFIGIGPSAPWHHPEFDFNDEALTSGSALWAEIVESRMPAA